MKKSKIIRKILCAVLAVSVVFVFAACSSGNKDVDTAAMAQELSEKLKFDDDLQKTDGEAVKVLYGIDYAEEAQLYIGSGATAEEIAVFKLKDDNDANKAVEDVKKRVENQKNAFENYVPAEVDRLNSAIIRKNGNYVVFCVTSDDSADSIINSYF